LSTAARAETETAYPDCTTAAGTAVFYDVDGSGYTVGIALEGKGTDEAGSRSEDPGYFVVVR
jgi:hypothetical protein